MEKYKQMRILWRDSEAYLRIEHRDSTTREIKVWTELPAGRLLQEPSFGLYYFDFESEEPDRDVRLHLQTRLGYFETAEGAKQRTQIDLLTADRSSLLGPPFIGS